MLAASAFIVFRLAIVFSAVAVCRASAALPGQNVNTDQKQMEASWADLEKGEVEATRALLGLYDRRNDAIPFLKGKMKPLAISSGGVKRLLLRLNSGDEQVWKSAFEELEYFDPRLAIELPELMDRMTGSPARQRLVEVLSERDPGSLKGKDIQLSPVGEGFNFFAPNFGSWWAEPKVSRLNAARWGSHKKKWTRAACAIVLLEHVRTPEATAILKDMATGHPEAAPTKIAKAALEQASVVKPKLESCWVDLEKEEGAASRALLELYDNAGEAVRVLKEKMRPLTISAEQVNALLSKLSSNDERVWKPAFLELEYFDPRLAIGLEDLMDHVKELPARQRMVEVLSERDAGSLAGQEIQLWKGNGFFNFTARGSWWAEHQVSEINSKGWGTVKRKWTRAERRDCPSGTHPQSGGDLHLEGDGDRSSRCAADEGCQGGPGEDRLTGSLTRMAARAEADL